MRSALPTPSISFCLFACGSLCAMVCAAMLHCIIVLRVACFYALCVIVSHGFFITHKHSRGKGTNFVHAVCGQCGQSWAVLSSAPKTVTLHQPYTHIFFLSYKKTLPTTTHNKAFSICCKALSVSHWGTFSLPTQNHNNTHIMQIVHNDK